MRPVKSYAERRTGLKDGKTDSPWSVATVGESARATPTDVHSLGFWGSYHEARTLARVVWRGTDQRPRQGRTGEQEGSRNAYCAAQTSLAQRRATATRHQELIADENGRGARRADLAMTTVNRTTALNSRVELVAVRRRGPS